MMTTGEHPTVETQLRLATEAFMQWQDAVRQVKALLDSGRRTDAQELQVTRLRQKRLLLRARIAEMAAVMLYAGCFSPLNPMPGEENPAAKLTWEQVNDIRDIYLSGTVSTRALAREFGVGKSQMWEIVANKSWCDPEYVPERRNNVAPDVWELASVN